MHAWAIIVIFLSLAPRPTLHAPPRRVRSVPIAGTPVAGQLQAACLLQFIDTIDTQYPRHDGMVLRSLLTLRFFVVADAFAFALCLAFAVPVFPCPCLSFSFAFFPSIIKVLAGAGLGLDCGGGGCWAARARFAVVRP